MSSPETDLAQDRATRNLARGLFDTRLAQVKSDFAARGIGGRIKDRLGNDARMAATTTLEIAKAQKGVVAGTAAALALWFARKPILAWASKLLPADQEEQGSE